VDRTIAIVASIPMAYLIYWRLRQGTLDIVRIALILQSLLLIATMVARRPPVRVTLNPWFWLLAFVATYWIPFSALAAPAGITVAPRWLIVSLSVLGLLMAFYARLSLGRNIGFVPAQRQIVTKGAYGFVRHPIYTAAFVNYVALFLLRYSLGTAVLVGLGILWFLVKSVVEERFLRTDPEYSAYMARVRRRWIPGVV
jgi:protein-S-isoprenylcysteine O-methyltransferase Ste14